MCLATAAVALAGCGGGDNATAPEGFLWGAATSSYQVEGGIDCSSLIAGNAQTLPCNDYDFFNRDPTIHATVRFNTGKAGPAVDIAAAGDADRVWEPAVFKRDFSYARLLGLNAFRFSLEWGRIEPTRPTVDENRRLVHHWDAAALERYDAMIDAMRKRGIEPIVSLNHFTLPIWVLRPPNDQQCRILFCFPTAGETGYNSSLRGWENPQTIDRYVEFVQHVVARWKDRVDFWLTVNEPVGSQVGVGYVAGVWSPGFLSDGPRAKIALHNLIQAHVTAYDVISDCTNFPSSCDDKDADGDGVAKQVGFAHAMAASVASPAGPGGIQALNDSAAIHFSYFLNDYFVNAVTKGHEDLSYLHTLIPGGASATFPSCSANPSSACTHDGSSGLAHDDWRNHLDFLGINYYRRFHVYHDDKLSFAGTGFLGGNQHNNLYGEPEPHSLLNDLGWAMYPQGLYDLLMRAKNDWNVPVMITENGTPERADRNRAPHVVAHLREIARAIADGVHVIGYMYWSLVDNWELQESYHPQARFGLFHIERNLSDPGQCATPNCERLITEGALAYKQVIDESRAANQAGTPTTAAVDNASAKFGAVAADGSEVLPPARTGGRLWYGSTSEGALTLYLGSVRQRVTGLTYWHGAKQWRRVDLTIGAQGTPILRETWFDDATDSEKTRTISATYENGVFSLLGGSVSPIPATGLWRWDSDQSPWGADYFSISKFEHDYTGKYLTFSSPQPQDVPTFSNPPPNNVCGAGGCTPDVSGSIWKELTTVQVGPHLRLANRGRLDGLAGDHEDLFDLTFALTSPIGSSVATTLAASRGSFAVAKSRNVLDAHFHMTGYLSQAGDWTWIGQRDGSTKSKFQFLEHRGLFQEFPVTPPVIGDKGDQYEKENDPTSVLPLDSFRIDEIEWFIWPWGARGPATKWRISWRAGGRAYTIETSAGALCASPWVVCEGTWSDIGGLVARRVSERFPPVATLSDRTVEANAPGGANVTLGPAALDLDGAPLNYTWTGPFDTTSGANPNVFLALGSQTVCAAVSNAWDVVRSCATFTVADTKRPTVVCELPDKTWHADDVSLRCTATDNGSGLADSADASFALATNVASGTETADAATASRRVCDNAGNCANAGAIGGNKIDKNAPTITIASPKATDYPRSATLTLSYTVTDGGSGVATVTARMDGATMLAGHSLSSGQVIDVSTELSRGQHTFAVSAADNVGNAGSASVGFEVIPSRRTPP